MSTIAFIGVTTPNRTVRYTICTHDGYLSWAGNYLLANFDSRSRAEQLIAQGRIHSLGPSIEESKFYRRDLGKPDLGTITRYHIANTTIPYPVQLDHRPNTAAESAYLYTDNGWLVADVQLLHEPSHLLPLAQAIQSLQTRHR